LTFMRIATWDSGLHWDDPNLRWGEPAYLLEPGDPGYVADPRSASFPASKPKKQRTNMPKGEYIKGPNEAFAQQLLNFKNNISPYVTLFSLTTAQVNAQAADADRFNYEVICAQLC